MKTTILLSILLILSRIWVAYSFEPESASIVGSYQAFAHLFVGGLIVAWFCQRKAYQAWLFCILVAVEVSAAVLSRVL